MMRGQGRGTQPPQPVGHRRLAAVVDNEEDERGDRDVHRVRDPVAADDEDLQHRRREEDESTEQPERARHWPNTWRLSAANAASQRKFW